MNTTPSSPAIVLAIDPGTRRMGYAIFRGAQLAAAGVYRLQGFRARETLDDAERWLRALIARHSATVIALEQSFTMKGPRTPQLRAVIARLRRAATAAGLTVHLFPPTAIRNVVVGSPWATKEEVMLTLIRRGYPQLKVFATARSPQTRIHWYHMFDAVAVGVAYRLLKVSPIQKRFVENRAFRKIHVTRSRE
jgi:Holliday junction resolvasome RuvABC endonuclease subunit